MELESLHYRKEQGWSKPFPNLNSPNTLILIFGDPNFIDSPESLKELVASYPDSKIIGCSSAGVIMGAEIVDSTLTVTVIKFDKTRLELINTAISSTTSFTAGKKIGKELIERGDDLRSIFTLSEGLNVNGSEFVKGLNQQLQNHNVIITGGLAGDGNRFKKTWTICNGEFYSDHVNAVGFYGDNIEVGHGYGVGFNIFGPERRITRSDRNVLFELDGKPALALYKEYLGERAQGLPATGMFFPLAIRQSQEDSHQLIRSILAIDEKNQSLTFAGDVPTGYLAQLMRANFDRLIFSASEAAESSMKKMLRENSKSNGVLAIAVSCVGRRILLGERTEEETETLLNNLPPKTVQVGFYSYGELTPTTHGLCDLHNQTITVTTFYEK